jgi:Tryptophan 2,3-dioxygenase (vermilion)
MPPLTYASYLDLEKLLTLQKPRSSPPEHDEMLFIIIHQTYELWFKQLLHEFEKIKRDFSAGDLFGAIHSFKRTRTIMKTLVAQVDILETMTPSSFSSFRDRLETAPDFNRYNFERLNLCSDTNGDQRCLCETRFPRIRPTSTIAVRTDGDRSFL